MTERTAVNQPPQAGNDYPFTAEHALIPLVQDLYLSYQDETCEFVRPFRLRWLFGLGTNPGVQPGDMPTPTHDVDLVIIDADEQTVFDSTTAEFGVNDWGDDRRIYEWVGETGVCRLVAALDAVDEFDDHEDHDDAYLDARTYHRLQRRVSAVRVGLQRLTENVRIQAGYNLALSVEDGARIDGGRFVNRINIDGVPGAGAGRLTGCEDVEPVLRRINQQLPDAGGTFHIDADDCLRLQPSLFITDTELTRTAQYTAEGYTAEEAKSLLKLYDDCRPCCDCDYFVRTYRGLSRLWDKWVVEAQDLETIRDTYTANRERWLDYYACRIANPIRIIALTERACRSFFGASYCNTSKCCLNQVELRFTFQLFSGGVLTDLVPTIREFRLDGSPLRQEEAYSPLQTGSVMRAFLDYANPQAVSSARFRILTSGCIAGESIRITVSAHTVQPPPNQQGDTCILPDADVPADILAVWTGAGLSTDDVRGVLQRDLPLDPTPQQGSTYC